MNKYQALRILKETGHKVINEDREWINKKQEDFLRVQADKLIKLLNMKFIKSGFDARLAISPDASVRYSDGYYLPVKSEGKWDFDSRMLNAKMDGTELNGVKYYNNGIYLVKGWRPTSFRGTR